MLLLTLLTGIWRGIFALPGNDLPVNFEVSRQGTAFIVTFHNAEERIVCDDVTLKEDSLWIRMPLYDSEFRLKLYGDSLKGKWINYARKGSPEIPFYAGAGKADRFLQLHKATADVSGRWETWFRESVTDSSLAIGQFKQEGNKVSGTFLTESGDHRYLEGIVDADSLKLSVFDGFFCRLYLMKIEGDSFSGTFYSGNHFNGAIKGKRNESIKLKDAGTISTYEGKPAFTLPDADSNLVSLSDPKYKGKVVILQIMGTWCPNCMDEGAFLSEFYKKYKSKGVELIGLSFERTDDFQKASKYLKNVANRFSIEYPLLFAGTTGTKNMEKVLPGIKNFFSYPTTIFIGKDGEVKHIHAGFNGPATGEDYLMYQKEFVERVSQIIKE